MQGFMEDQVQKMVRLKDETGLTHGQTAIRSGTSKTVVVRLAKKARVDRDAGNAS